MARKTTLGAQIACRGLDLTKIIDKRIDVGYKDELVRVAYSGSEAQYYVLERQEGFWRPLHTGTLEGILSDIKSHFSDPMKAWYLDLYELVGQAAKIEGKKAA